MKSGTSATHASQPWSGPGKQSVSSTPESSARPYAVTGRPGDRATGRWGEGSDAGSNSVFAKGGSPTVGEVFTDRVLSTSQSSVFERKMRAAKAETIRWAKGSALRHRRIAGVRTR